MRIGASTPYVPIQPARATSAAPATDAASAQSADPAKTFDPTNASRQDVRDWVNGQIRSGQMSLRDSTVFVSLTVQAPGAAADANKIDFLDQARQAIGGAAFRGDQDDVARMGWALDRMQGVDIKV